MNERVIVQLAEIILAIAAIGGIAIIIAATWHDMRAIARKARLNAVTSGPPQPHQPSVMVLIYAHDNTVTIDACLKSITANTYDDCKIVVVDNTSTDTTVQVTSDYKKAHPRVNIKVHSLKQSLDRASALHAAYQKNNGSDLVFIIDATDQLSPTAILSVAAHFIARPNLVAMRIRRQLSQDMTIASLPRHFFMLSENILRKTLPRYAVTHKALSDSGVIVRSSVFSADAATKKPITTYDSTIIYTSANTARHSNASVHRRVITLGLIIALLACIALMTYFFYTAATLRSNALLTLSWIIVSLWLLATIWSDEILASSKKITLTFTVPFMYFLLYAKLFFATVTMIIKLISGISLPKINMKSIHDALLHEAYSTHF